MNALYIIVGLALGAGAGYFYRQQIASKRIGSAEANAEKLLDEAKAKEKELLTELAEIRGIDLTKGDKKDKAGFFHKKK